MALLGQSSGGWTESSSALRILYVGVRNSIGILTNDSFTQTNPPIQATFTTTATGFDSSVLGVMSGSVAFTRPDGGSNYVGGPATVAATTITGIQAAATAPIGVFLNNAAGLAYTNTPAVASGKGPYVSSQGTYANSLYETLSLGAAGGYAAGNTLVYLTGQPLMASLNGYLMPANDNAAAPADISTDVNVSITALNATNHNTIMGILKMPADTTQAEIVYDQRI
jgi:hypothetical protein